MLLLVATTVGIHMIPVDAGRASEIRIVPPSLYLLTMMIGVPRYL